MEPYLYIDESMDLLDRDMALRAKFGLVEYSRRNLGPWPTLGSPWKSTFLGYDPIDFKHLL